MIIYEITYDGLPLHCINKWLQIVSKVDQLANTIYKLAFHGKVRRKKQVWENTDMFPPFILIPWHDCNHFSL